MKQASFYCENCGKPVSLEEHTCPSCGKDFSAIRCPVCSFTGNNALFYSGCPSCGYLSGEEGKGKKPVVLTQESRKDGHFFPSWFFPSVSLVLIIVIVILAVILLK